jgi:hypothetical protein
MPTAELSEQLFARLQKHAVPLVDTLESVIARGLDALEVGRADTVPASGPTAFDPENPPNLHHTTPKRVRLNGKLLPQGETYWNYLMYACVRAAAESGLNPAKVKGLMVVPAVIGVKTDNGYRPIPEAGLSVQGQDANGAWKQAQHIAKAMGFKLEVEFTWQNVEKAAFPNLSGVFEVGG